jgi:hypothetical protein
MNQIHWALSEENAICICMPLLLQLSAAAGNLLVGEWVSKEFSAADYR